MVKLTRKVNAGSNFVVPQLGRIQGRMTAIQTMPEETNGFELGKNFTRKSLICINIPVKTYNGIRI
jgi:hypothetical protein